MLFTAVTRFLFSLTRQRIRTRTRVVRVNDSSGEASRITLDGDRDRLEFRASSNKLVRRKSRLKEGFWVKKSLNVNISIFLGMAKKYRSSA